MTSEKKWQVFYENKTELSSWSQGNLGTELWATGKIINIAYFDKRYDKIDQANTKRAMIGSVILCWYTSSKCSELSIQNLRAKGTVACKNRIKSMFYRIPSMHCLNNI